MSIENKVTIESLEHEGRGVAHFDGKVIFIEGALTGEVVSYSSYRKKPAFEQAQVVKIFKTSSMRVQPKCKHFGVCGGCSMQHLDARAQVAVKQRILEDGLRHIGKVKPETILPAIYGEAWGYRERARISVKYVIKKSKMLVGFHEKRSSYVADMQSCEILAPKIAKLLPLLADLISGLSIRDKLPQIEVAVGEQVDALVLRVMETPSRADEDALRAFADEHHIQFWLQSKGPETIVPFHPLDAPELSYSLPEFNITMPFAPSEFTQVNSALNRVMMHAAISNRVSAIKIWRPDGVIAYSNWHDKIGQQFRPTTNFLRALGGAISAEFEGQYHEQDSDERALETPLLEIYAPVRERNSERIIAISEFYEAGADVKSLLARAGAITGDPRAVATADQQVSRVAAGGDLDEAAVACLKRAGR